MSLGSGKPSDSKIRVKRGKITIPEFQKGPPVTRVTERCIMLLWQLGNIQVCLVGYRHKNGDNGGRSCDPWTISWGKEKPVEGTATTSRLGW